LIEIINISQALISWISGLS